MSSCYIYPNLIVFHENCLFMTFIENVCQWDMEKNLHFRVWKNVQHSLFLGLKKKELSRPPLPVLADCSLGAWHILVSFPHLTSATDCTVWNTLCLCNVCLCHNTFFLKFLTFPYYKKQMSTNEKRVSQSIILSCRPVIK